RGRLGLFGLKQPGNLDPALFRLHAGAAGLALPVRSGKEKQPARGEEEKAVRGAEPVRGQVVRLRGRDATVRAAGGWQRWRAVWRRAAAGDDPGGPDWVPDPDWKPDGLAPGEPVRWPEHLALGEPVRAPLQPVTVFNDPRTGRAELLLVTQPLTRAAD